MQENEHNETSALVQGTCSIFPQRFRSQWLNPGVWSTDGIRNSYNSRAKTPNNLIMGKGLGFLQETHTPDYEAYAKRSVLLGSCKSNHNDASSRTFGDGCYQTPQMGTPP